MKLKILFFTGNKYIHLLTEAGDSDVYLKLQHENGTWLYARYKAFTVAAETDNFRMTLNETSYMGNAGIVDRFLLYLNLWKAGEK